MKKRTVLVLAAAMATVGLGAPRVIAQGPPPPPPGYQGPPPGGWEAPPPELQEVERRAYHDGIEGARRDAENHRQPNVYNRDEYRHPPVPHHDRRAYRKWFERGYQTGVEHLMRR